ncbi:Exocyst complex component protein [Mycena venus]|uniref:Exocyst complex component protein n=1 Tax=Mycena venus TaxID=2733690 RepID=A0A8H6Y687_9AGAR|nr:Exocyst complex component protein [Mycena venus]
MSRRPAAPTLDPSVEEHLQLSAFKAKFDVTEFIGNVSEKLIAQSKGSSGPFDPKPFINTFEAAVDKLIAVRKDVQSKTEQMEKGVRISEREYSKKMAELNRGFETVGNSFAGMESRMNEVSSTAVRIGEQLETVHIERQRAQAAYDLIDFYNQFSRGDTTRLDTLRKEGRAGRRQVAVLLRRLNTVAKEVDLPTADKTRENIEKYCEKFEKEMLNLFDRCYRRGDPKMMHHCAQTLLEFNGGASCVQVYVNQHDFFINHVRETKPADDTLLWNTLPDPDASPPQKRNRTDGAFRRNPGNGGHRGPDRQGRVSKSSRCHAGIPAASFCTVCLSNNIWSSYFIELRSISDLAYLRVLQLVHIQATALVEDLKSYELPSVAPRTPFEATEFRRSLTGSATAGTTTSATVSTMLESAMEELFVPYTEGQRYLERESRSLGTLYSTLLVNFTRYHARTQKAGKSSMFDTMINQLSSTSGGSSTSAQAAAVLMRFGGIGSSAQKQEKTDDEPVREEDGLLNVQTAETMLKWHAEAMGRCIELSTSTDVAKNTFALLRVLSEAIGTAYVEAAIETAQARVEAADAKSEPNLQPLMVLRLVALICHLWQQYVNTALLPLASSSVTIRREMVVFNNQTVSRLEGGANMLTQRITDSIISWLSSHLAKQKKNDFKPRNDDLSFARVNTEPCVACCETLEKVRDAAKSSMSGKNLEVFLTEVGVSFHSLLLEHLRKFPVSDAGGLMLAKDIKSYQDTIATFGIPALHERFEFIRQLGNIFLIQPETLKSYITENYLGRVDANLLKPYIALRSDWGQFEKGFNDANGEDAGSGKGFKDRFGRLSVIMKEVEGLKLEGLKFGENITMPSIPSSFAGSFSAGGFSLGSRFGT